MKLKFILLALLLVGTLTFIRCQDDEDEDDFDSEDLDVQVEEEEDVAPIEQVEYSPPEPTGPYNLAEPFDSADVLGTR